MGMDYRYLLFFERDACLDVLERLADMAVDSAEGPTVLTVGERTVTLPFAGWMATGSRISWDDPSPCWDFMTVLCFEPDEAIESYLDDPRQHDDLGRATIGYVYLSVHRDMSGWPSGTDEDLVLFEFGTPGSKMSVLFTESESIRRSFIDLLESGGVYGVLDREDAAEVFWLRGVEMTTPLPTAEMTLADIEILVGGTVTIQFSFSAEVVASTARHLRRRFGGTDLGVHHWLSALHQANVRLPAPTAGTRQAATAAELERLLADGDIGALLSEDEVRALATNRTRQDGRHLVTVEDLAHVIVASTNPPADVSCVVAFYPEGLLHKFGFGDGDMLDELIEEHDLGVDHHDLLIAVVEQLVVPRIDQTVETYTIESMHNPVRADTIDGEQADSTSTLTPRVVEIPVADIIRVARTLPPCDETEY